MGVKTETSIAERNRDIEHIVNAAAKYGSYGLGKMLPKRFAMLITTDIHRCGKQLKRATEYLDEMDALDVGICLGDMQGCDFAENDGTWYTDVVCSTKKPFYTVIGNHDGGNSCDASICGNKRQVFEKFILPTRNQMQMPDLDRTYYAVRFDEYKICLIVLDNYDLPDDLDEKGDYVFHRSVVMTGQEQADWLQKTLYELPEDYHVMIAQHCIEEACTPIECNWTQEGYKQSGGGKGCVTTNLLIDIVDAWINGKQIKGEYSSHDFSMATSVKIDVDYSRRGKGNFIGYLIGHTHVDWLGVCEKYPEQHVINVVSSANDLWQNVFNDLPRLEGTKAEDCITVLAVDTEKRKLHLVRVGSNMTHDLKDRTFISLKY